MKLNKRQREFVIQKVGEGLETGEINKLAAKFKPPFRVTRQQVDHYRKTRAVDLGKIKEAGEYDALKTGLSLKEERVKLLHDLAALLASDIFQNDLLWTNEVKGIGSGALFEKVNYKEFNASEVRELRATLEDIAAEVGDRIRRQELTGKDGAPLTPPPTVIEVIKSYEKENSE